MRRVLSTHLFVGHRLTVALLDSVLSSGVSEVELFCARQHIDYHSRGQVEELKQWFRDSDMSVASMHSPMFSDDCWGETGPQAALSLTEKDKAKRIRATDEIKRAIEIADSIPFRYLIQHVGVAAEEYEPSKIDAIYEGLDELIVFGKQLGVEILLENIPNELSTADRLNSLLQETRLPLHYCFDAGHAHLAGGIEGEFEKMKTRIRSTHIHDNDGVGDTHLFPMRDGEESGTIDWAATMGLLGSLDDEVPLLLELMENPEIEMPLDEVNRCFDRLENA